MRTAAWAFAFLLFLPIIPRFLLKRQGLLTEYGSFCRKCSDQNTVMHTDNAMIAVEPGFNRGGVLCHEMGAYIQLAFN
jgi:hypothetical protein